MFYFKIIPENQCTLFTVIQNTHTHTHTPFLEYHKTGTLSWCKLFPLATPTSCRYIEESSYALYLEFPGSSTQILVHWFSFPIFCICNLAPPLPLPFVSYHSLHSIQTKVLTNSKICKHKEPLSETDIQFPLCGLQLKLHPRNPKCVPCCIPMGCRPPAPPSMEFPFQARILEWDAISYFKGSFGARD